MFSVKGSMKPLIKGLSRLERKQIPFATAMAINSTLFDIRKAEMAQTHKKLDRPTNATVKGFRVKKATKQTQSGEVFIPDHIWAYMKYQVEGGVRVKRTGVPYQKNAKLNKFGNIPARKKGLIKNKHQFVATINGITGVWQRGHVSKKGKFSSAGKSRATNVKLMVAYESNTNYSKRFPFYKIADGVAKSKFGKNFKREMARAMRSAR